MKVIGLFAAIALVHHVALVHSSDSSLVGVWTNPTETYTAYMIIDKANDGHLSGTYCHFGFPTTDKFQITGSYDKTGSETGGTVAWAGVQSKNTKPPVRTWSGQRFVHKIPNSYSDKLIVATWMETTQTTYDDSWESTTIGKETFQKISSQPGDFYCIW